MLIVADENMPHAHTLFSHLGDVELVAGRSLSSAAVRDADLLMVRSVTRVNADLLAGSRVKFVGTATIGTDHVDEAWLESQGIGFASAPGCNAESVAQWVAAALVDWAGRRGRSLSKMRLGIVGVGNCGSRVERVARALGMEPVLNDPPLARQSGDPSYRPLQELLDCDVITLHVPLTRVGEDPTWNLFNAEVLSRLRPDALLINACRGYVVDESALIAQLDRRALDAAILDAWENEPRINPEMLKRVFLGTPHIAGYSFDGKVTGTRMIYEAACRHLKIQPKPTELPMPPAPVQRISLDARGRTFESVAAELILTAYPIERDHADLMRAAHPDPDKMGSAFDRCRKLYPLRREFIATAIDIDNSPDDWPRDWIDRLHRLGFNRVDYPSSRHPAARKESA